MMRCAVLLWFVCMATFAQAHAQAAPQVDASPAVPSTPPASTPAPAVSVSSTPEKGTASLGRFGFGRADAPSFELVAGPCVRPRGAPKTKAADCPLLVRAPKGGQVRLEWVAPAGAVVAQGDDTRVIGDDVDAAIAVTLRPIEVKKGVFGVVVTEQTGSDRVKRRHDILLLVKGELTRALDVVEPRGASTFSSVTPVDMDADGYSELIVVQSQTPDEEEPDRWSVETWAWQPAGRRMAKIPAWRPTVQAALAGMFRTVKEARESQAEKCMREFLVVDNQSATLLPDGVVALAYLAPTVAGAQAALDVAKACDEDVVAGIKPVSPGLTAPE